MALAHAQRVRVQQVGNTVVGEQVDYVLDEEAGILGQKKTMVAMAGDSRGGVLIVQEQVTVAQTADVSPRYTPRSSGYTPRPALTTGSYDTVDSGDSSDDELYGYMMKCFWVFCSCCILAVSLAIIIPIGVVGLVTCPTLQGAGAVGIILGIVTFLFSCVCCVRCFIKDGTSFKMECACCSLITVLLLLFVGALIAITVLVAVNIDFIYDSTPPFGVVPCTAPVVAVAVMGMSYGMLLLFGAFCICSIYYCYNSCDS